METGWDKTVAGKAPGPWRPSQKQAILSLVIFAVVCLGVGVSYYWGSQRGRVGSDAGEALDGMRVFFDSDRTFVERILVKRKELKPGLSFEDVKRILGEPQSLTYPSTKIDDPAPAKKMAPNAEFIASYYIGHNFYLFYFSAASPPR